MTRFDRGGISPVCMLKLILSKANKEVGMVSKKSFDDETSGRTSYIFLGCLFLLMLFTVPCAEAYDHIVTGFNMPENSLQTAGNGRIFVTSNGTVYEVMPDENLVEWPKTKVANDVDQSCQFMGITETNGYVYTVCTENFYAYYAVVRLFALEKYSGTIMTEVANTKDNINLRKVDAPNGMTTDGKGNLYLADHGAPGYPGAVYKIHVSGENIVSEVNVSKIYSFKNCKANGIKYYNGYLYITVNPTGYIGLNQLLRYKLDANGNMIADSRKVIFSSSYTLDDFFLIRDTVRNEDGCLIAQTTGARVIHINEAGEVKNIVLFYIPSSVRLLQNNDLIVTDWVGAAAYIWQSDWGVVPR